MAAASRSTGKKPTSQTPTGKKPTGTTTPRRRTRPTAAAVAEQARREEEQRRILAEERLSRSRVRVDDLSRELRRVVDDRDARGAAFSRSLAATEARLEEERRKVRRLKSANTRPPRVVGPLEMALKPFPVPVQAIVREITAADYMASGIEAMMTRADDFSSGTAAVLAGIAMNPAASEHFDRRLDEVWVETPDAKFGTGGSGYDEVVIGGGYHASIYCAVRVGLGNPKPLVLEAKGRAGGILALSRSASFYGNSRNRPGPASIPGREGALNVIPGSLVQPSDMDGAEYQTNSAMAMAIRATLAMNAIVRPNSLVNDIRYGRGRRQWNVRLTDGTVVRAGRVILALGLGEPRVLATQASERILTYPEFMARFDGPFPLRGMQRVAVVGAGDSGKTVIEALCGQGPQAGGSVSSLDWPGKIDWYGVPRDRLNATDWERCNRSRYRQIARLFPRGSGIPFRVRPLNEKAKNVAPGYECAFVNERPYDYVITATGFDPGASPRVPLALGPLEYGGRTVALSSGGDNTLLSIGPRTGIDISEVEEQALSKVPLLPESNVALFRYASRTAQAAMAVSGIPV